METQAAGGVNAYTLGGFMTTNGYGAFYITHDDESYVGFAYFNAATIYEDDNIKLESTSGNGTGKITYKKNCEVTVVQCTGAGTENRTTTSVTAGTEDTTIANSKVYTVVF